jgi:dTDP-4-dehydrorhamnose 3,5-epimerase
MINPEALFSETSLDGVWKGLQPTYTDMRGETTELLNLRWEPSLFSSLAVNQIIRAKSVMGTIRGIHFSAPTNPQFKVISCISGEIKDCVIDLRPNSPTFRKYEIFDLSADRKELLFISPGFGHAYQVLSNGAEVLYALQTDFNFNDEYALNPLDSEISIPWEKLTPILSERDKNAPNLADTIRAHFS